MFQSVNKLKSQRRHERGFLFPIIAALTVAIVTIASMLIGILTIKMREYTGSSMCSLKAYYAADSALKEISNIGQLAGYAANCNAGEYAISNSNACGQPGNANTLTPVGSECSYSVQILSKTSNQLQVEAIGRCNAGPICGNGKGSVMKINAALNYASVGGPCPTTGAQKTDNRGSEVITYNTAWFDINNNGTEDANECWFKENLRTSTTPAGAALTHSDASGDYLYAITDGSCVGLCEDPDLADQIALGNLYDWSATMNGDSTSSAQGLCPSLWHIPSAAQWNSLATYLGSEYGKRLKPAVSGTYWTASGYVGDGSTLFNSLGSGYVNAGFPGTGRNTATYYWTSDSASPNATARRINYNTSADVAENNSQANFYSVRCVKN